MGFEFGTGYARWAVLESGNLTASMATGRSGTIGASSVRHIYSD
jgi:hypothetical protein